MIVRSVYKDRVTGMSYRAARDRNLERIVSTKLLSCGFVRTIRKVSLGSRCQDSRESPGPAACNAGRALFLGASQSGRQVSILNGVGLLDLSRQRHPAELVHQAKGSRHSSLPSGICQNNGNPLLRLFASLVADSA